MERKSLSIPLPNKLRQVPPPLVERFDLCFLQVVPIDVAQHMAMGEVLPQECIQHLPEELPRCVIIRHGVVSLLKYCVDFQLNK